MATINVSTNNSQWTFKLEVTEGNYDITNNTSPVTVTMYLGRASSQSYVGGNWTGNITIDGSSYDLSGIQMKKLRISILNSCARSLMIAR